MAVLSPVQETKSHAIAIFSLVLVLHVHIHLVARATTDVTGRHQTAN